MSLYLKYRPQDFENLEGQKFIKQTLQKAVQDDKTVGAYLFCGPRGTGKTSSARIFAKAINCLNGKEEIINSNQILNDVFIIYDEKKLNLIIKEIKSIDANSLSSLSIDTQEYLYLNYISSKLDDNLDKSLSIDKLDDDLDKSLLIDKYVDNYKNIFDSYNKKDLVIFTLLLGLLDRYKNFVDCDIFELLKNLINDKNENNIISNLFNQFLLSSKANNINSQVIEKGLALINSNTAKHRTKNNLLQKPCNFCKSCLEINLSSAVDIMEIDAASHTGVDNIREIIERAQFAPNKTKYKIYIIDEVHMLSKGAFNALLKILEEPPTHVKFILATTETHKVPDTIISRCQRYDFKSINEHDMIHRLNYIASEENVTIDKESLNYIVKNSGGAFRNAISLFEQLIEDNNISYDRVVEKLGIVGEDILKNFLNKLIQLDSSITDDFDELIASGKNIKLFFRELIFYTKNESLKKLKKAEEISSYIRILEILDESYTKTKNSLDENTTFLIGILKIVTVYNSQENSSIDKPVIEKTITPKIIKEEILEPKAGIFNNPVEPVIQEQAQAVSVDEAFDIFSDDATMESPAAIENNSIPKVKSSFDVKSYIDSIKTAGAKGALTMALRGSDIYLQGSKLHIKTKTKIAAAQVANVDNKTLMLQVLQNTVLPDGELVIL